MGRILTPDEFPFPVPVGAAWDGSTFVENGTAEFASLDTYPLYTPDWVKTGNGTLYPLPAMTRDTAMRILKRVRAWDYEEDIDGVTASYVLRAGASEQDLDDGAQQESDLSHLYGLNKTYELGEGVFTGIVFRLFRYGYEAFPLLSQQYDYDGGTAYPTAHTLDFSSFAMVRIGTSYYPRVLHGYLNSPTSITSTQVKGGDPSNIQGGSATLTFDASTLTFTGSGTDYSFTVAPKATDGFWTYGGLYDPDTGLPV